MIDAKDLHIGNWVTCYGNTFQVGIIEEYYVEPIGRNDGSYPFEELSGIPLTPDILLRCMFKAIPHFTITNTHILDVGRGRILSIGCIGEPNEMLWLCNIDHEDPKKITDLVCLHNFDYDGKLYMHRLQNIAMELTGQELTFNQQ